MVLFRNLNKACNDLMQRDFAHDKPWKIDLRHAGKNPVLSETAFVDSTGGFTALSSIRHTGSWGFIDTKLGSSSVSTDVSFKSPFIPGITAGCRFERKHNASKDSKDSVDLTVEFNQENITTKIKATESAAIGILCPHIYLSANPILMRWTASTTAGINFGSNVTLRMGGEVTASGNLDKSLNSLSYSVGCAISQTANGKSWLASVMGYPHDSQALGKIVGSIHCKNSNPGAAEVGAEVIHYPQNGRADVTFAGQWYLNQPPTGGRTDTYLKMKLTHDAKLAVALTHKLSDLITATLGGQIDTLKPDAAKYGLSLNITT